VPTGCFDAGAAVFLGAVVSASAGALRGSGFAGAGGGFAGTSAGAIADGAGAACAGGATFRTCASGVGRGAIADGAGAASRGFDSSGLAATGSGLPGAACSGCHGRNQPIAMPAPTRTAASKP
jgi:hypothetical protein